MLSTGINMPGLLMEKIMKKVIFRRKGRVEEWEVDGDFEARAVLNRNRDPRLIFEADAAPEVIDLRPLRTIVLRGKARQREWMVKDFLSRAQDFRGAFLFAPGRGRYDVDGGCVWFTDVKSAARAGIDVSRKIWIDREIEQRNWMVPVMSANPDLANIKNTDITIEDVVAVWRVCGRREIIISDDWHDRRMAWTEDGGKLSTIAEIVSSGRAEPVSGEPQTFEELRQELAPALFVSIPGLPSRSDVFMMRLRWAAITASDRGWAYNPSPRRDCSDEILRVIGVTRREAEIATLEQLRRWWHKFALTRDSSYWLSEM